jgi:hypothetical protein
LRQGLNNNVAVDNDLGCCAVVSDGIDLVTIPKTVKSVGSYTFGYNVEQIERD